MAWLTSSGAAILGALAGGVASAYGGYLAARRQQRLASVAAAKLVCAELLRDKLRLESFEKAPAVSRWLLRRSFPLEQSAWASHASALTLGLDNDTFVHIASAYVQAELAEVIGSDKEQRRTAANTITEAANRLAAYIEDSESKALASLSSDLRWEAG